MQPVQFTLHNALTRWQWGIFPLFVLAILVALATWYLRADWKLALRGRRWKGARTLSFLAGLVAVDVAVQSPIAALSMGYFQAHVIQHLLLMVVAPPLLALGAPSTLLLQTSKRQTKERWLAVLRSRPFAAISHPIVVWFFYFGVMFVFFLSSLINVAMHHMALMDLLNVMFLLGGTLYWWPMVGIDPIIHWKMSYGMRLLNLLLGSAVEAFLGIAILAASRPTATMYTLASTRSGGALLWVSTELSTLGGFLPIYIQWSRSEARAGLRADAHADERAAQLTPVSEAALATDGQDASNHVPATAWEAAWFAKFGQVPGGTMVDPSVPVQPTS
ncbi:MAG: cytochrome c oxidase assembly protein [Acidimicrobiales bacterium]